MRTASTECLLAGMALLVLRAGAADLPLSNQVAVTRRAGVVPANGVLFGARTAFDAAFDPARVQGGGYARAERAGTEAAPALRVTTAPAKNNPWPGIALPVPASMWDLSPFEYVTVDIRNLDTHDVEVFVRVDNPGANGRDHCLTERAGVQPDQRVTLNVPLRRASHSPIRLFGMNGYPQGLYPDQTGIDPAAVSGITVFTMGAATQNVFEIANVRAAGRYTTPAWADMPPEQFFPFVDVFGQFAHKEWPGKVHAAAELVRTRDAEAAALAADPGPASWDRWGGWAQGPALRATGHFRTEKHRGKWWLVDPDGRLFFSTGLTCVSARWAGTPIEDRTNWFAALPPDDAAHKAFYSRAWKSGSGYYAGREPRCVDFSALNLERKYGADWATNYPATIHQRLRHWGINTLGNWSDGAICRQQRTPYTLTFFYDCQRLKSGFPDVFDPKFAPAVAAGADRWLRGTTNDPWCIGYFLDNEMPWGGETTLARQALAAPATQPARQELLRWLQARYPAPADLQAAWGCACPSWEAFAAAAAPNPKSAAAERDLAAFTGLFAETYFRTVHDAIKRLAPDKLYLGCRCVGGSTNIVASAVKYCDVVSYNRYCHSVRDVRLPEGYDAPILIGEFHFGALDRGLFWTGLVSADNQEDRGRKYADYVNSALDNPQTVGTHWFQYGDEAVTGRGDGENAQCGFVDVCDTPYAETVRAAREIGETMYARRFSQGGAAGPAAKGAQP